MARQTIAATPRPARTAARAMPGVASAAGCAVLPQTAIGSLAIVRPTPGGLPATLRAGIEALSGVSMAGVRVRYNSPHLARLGALAYARGREIHLAAGQERHLPHEAWHIAQQAQGRVLPTAQFDDGMTVNEDHGLEREADAMGARAANHAPSAPPTALAAPALSDAQPLQARGSLSKRRRRWKAARTGQRPPRGTAPEATRNLTPLGDKHVTVYRVEHDDKPSILAADGPRHTNRSGVTPDAPDSSATVKPHMRKPTQDLKLTAAPDNAGVHWFSLGTPDRAIANRRQRVGNQLEAYGKARQPGQSRTLPDAMLPKLKSFQIPVEHARRIQQQSVLESEVADHPGRPINSDQNFAPNQFGLRMGGVREMAGLAVKNSYMEYDQSDLATLGALHGSGRSADDHRKRDEYPKGELRKQLGGGRGRGSGKRSVPRATQPMTYDRTRDPFEGRPERDRDLDPEARRYLARNRSRTLADFMPR